MLFSLFRNVAISAVAFLVTGVVGLLLVPVLVTRYGLSGFGLIVMTRMFLPTTTLAALDFGVGEYATQAVAMARQSSRRGECGTPLRSALSFAVAVGLATGACLYLASASLSEWLSVPPGQQAAFVGVLRWTAVSMPVLFASLVFEGIVKGMENFTMQRLGEVIATLLYAGLALGAVWLEWSFDAVCYALLVSLWVRALLALLVSVLSLRSWELRFERLSHEGKADFTTRARLMLGNKSLGVLQAHGAPMLISLMLGPAALGVYDALTRLPRFAKSVLGLLSSTVLPVAARMESGSDAKGLRRLGQTGTLMAGLVALPPIAAAMVFSQPILTLWLGPSLAYLWQWQALMFVLPAVSVLIGFGGAALIVRPQAFAAMNKLVIWQIAIQFAVSLALVHRFDEKSFILGQVIALLVTLVWQMRLIAAELNTPVGAAWRLLRIVMVAAALALPGAFVHGWISNLPTLAIAMCSWTLICWLVCYGVVLTADQRERLRDSVKSRLARSRSR